jgi:hypothetical protein
VVIHVGQSQDLMHQYQIGDVYLLEELKVDRNAQDFERSCSSLLQYCADRRNTDEGERYG